MKHHTRAALAIAALIGLGGAAAQPAANSIDAHLARGQGGCGFRFHRHARPSLRRAADRARPRRGAARPRPPRETWFTEPAKVFDNLYFVGTKVHSAWALTGSEGIILIDTLYEYASDEEIIGGLRKLGLDPAAVKYRPHQRTATAITSAAPN